MEFDVLGNDCVYMYYGKELWDYLEGDHHAELIRNFRKEEGEKNRFFPVLNCVMNNGHVNIGDFDVLLKIPDHEPVKFTVFEGEDYEELYEQADLVCLEALEIIIDAFKDYDFNEEIKKCRENPTVENLKRLERFYDLINHDRKLLFHYRKMLSQKNIPSAIVNLGRMYLSEAKGKKYCLQGKKVMALVDKHFDTYRTIY